MIIRRLALALSLLALLPAAAWGQTFRTERPAYTFGEAIRFVIDGLPAEQDVDIYSHFQPDGAPMVGGSSYGWQGGIISDLRGIVKGAIPAPPSEDGMPGTFMLEAREPDTGIPMARTLVRVVPISVTPVWEPLQRGALLARSRRSSAAKSGIGVFPGSSPCS